MFLREFRPTRMAFQYGASSGNLSLWTITWPRESSISCVIVNIQKISGFHRQLPIWLSRGSLTSSWAEVTPNGRYMDFTSAMIMRRISLHTWSPFASLPVVFFTQESGSSFFPLKQSITLQGRLRTRARAVWSLDLWGCPVMLKHIKHSISVRFSSVSLLLNVSHLFLICFSLFRNCFLLVSSCFLFVS